LVPQAQDFLSTGQIVMDIGGLIFQFAQGLNASVDDFCSGLGNFLIPIG